MKNFFISGLGLFLFGFNPVFLYCQTNLICVKVKDPLESCLGFDGVSIEIKDRFGQALCSGKTSSGGEYCCTINASDFPIDICANANCSFNGCIDDDDLDYLQLYVMGNPYNDWYPPDFEFYADINGDGNVDALDLNELWKIKNGTSSLKGCRFLSGYCKDLSPPISPACYSGCQRFNSASDINFNFWLYKLGDLVDRCSDTDCSVPLVGGPREEKFRISNGLNKGFQVMGLKNANGFIECVTNRSQSGIMIITLFDTNGRVIFTGRKEYVNDLTTHQIDISNINSGVYFLKIDPQSIDAPFLEKIIIVQP